MSNEAIIKVLNEIKSGNLKGERRTATVISKPNHHSTVPYLSRLLTEINRPPQQSFTSPVDMIVITNENLEECICVLKASKALGISYISFDDNGNASNDPYLAKIRYLSFGVSPLKAYIADLRIISIDSLVDLLTGKILKLLYDSLPFLGFMRHLKISINQVSDLRLLDIISLCGLGNLKPSISDTIHRHLGIKIDFPDNGLLNSNDLCFILATQSSYLFALAEVLYPKIRSMKLEKIAWLEMLSLFPLSDIQYNGMPFSIQRINEFSAAYQSELDIVASKLHNILDSVVDTPDGPVSVSVNLDSQKQLLRAFRRIGLTLPNTQNSTLSVYKNEYEAAALMIRYKHLRNIVHNLGDSYLRFVHPVTRKIHAKVNPIGTRTYRVIITEPNLQGIQHGTNRKFFKAPEGYVFVQGDYKQIEVFIYAVLSQDQVLLNDCNGDVYSKIAQLFLKRDSITSEDRKKMKPVVLGLFFDMTDYGIVSYSKGFGTEVTMAEAGFYRKLFFERYKRVAYYQKELAQKACVERSVASVLGRRRHFDTRSVIVERPSDLSFTDFKALVSSVINKTTTIDNQHAIYTVKNEYDARKLQDQLSELNLTTSIETCNPPMGAVYNGVAQMTCVDLLKTASSLIYPKLNKDCQIINTAHDDLTFIVKKINALSFGKTLKSVMEQASYELFKPYKAMVKIKTGEDYDLE